ncbi:MAG: dTMP kinase [Synergistaceae bacterium]|nr:dTMP kinase [Synergistaceae bacterium]
MFITFEGIDGSGKSTQARLFSDWLTKKYSNKKILLTREPGGWMGGELLREMVTDGTLKHQWSEAYLFMLDRCEHIAKVIQPALDLNADIVCERYHDSTLAYQVWGRGLPLEVFDTLALESKFPVPDITLFLDIPPALAATRVAIRGNIDAFESEGIMFMSKIREGYLLLAKRSPKRWITIDVSHGTVEEIFEVIIDSILTRGYFND